MSPRRRTLGASFLACAGLVLSNAVATADPTPAPPRVASAGSAAPSAPNPRIAVKVKDLGDWASSEKAALGATVLDVATGAVLAAFDEHRPMNPASNTKVLTAAAALDRLGPDYRFTTGVYGRIDGGVVAPLVLRGFGDPSFGMAELWELARSLKAQGVRRVDGVLVDQSYFDRNFTPPAFASEPNEWAPFRAPVSAVSLEENSVTLNVVPAQAGAPATAWFDPPGSVAIHGSVVTREKGAGDGVRLTLAPAGTHLTATIGGFIGEGGPRLRASKRVEDPSLFPGYALSEVLRLIGIEVRGDVAEGGRDVHDRVAFVESEPLSVLVHALGKDSDNFFAETILKALGAAEKAPPGTSKDGADAVVSWMRDVGAFEPGVALTNGSGLFDANRVTAMSLAVALRQAYASSRIGPEFVSNLAVGGVDGTLRARFRKEAVRRVVRAKTGTLDRVVALSGYVLTPPGRSPVAFSFVVEGAPGKHAEVRDHIDRCVGAIVDELWKP